MRSNTACKIFSSPCDHIWPNFALCEVHEIDLLFVKVVMRHGRYGHCWSLHVCCEYITHCYAGLQTWHYVHKLVNITLGLTLSKTFMMHMFCSVLLHVSLYIAVRLTALVFCSGDAMKWTCFSLYFSCSAYRMRIKLIYKRSYNNCIPHEHNLNVHVH